MYREDEDLAFLKNVFSENRSDLNQLEHILIYDSDGKKRVTEELSRKQSNLRYDWKNIAEEVQCYGGNTYANMLRFGKGVLYKEILTDVCDKHDVPYNKKAPISRIEDALLFTLLENEWNKMSSSDRTKLLNSVNIKSSNIIKAGSDLLALQGLLHAGGLLGFRLAGIISYGLLEATPAIMGTVLSFSLARSLSIFLGSAGWGLLLFSFSGPAYRVTTPACISIALLRKKYNLSAQEIARLRKEDELLRKMQKDINKHKADSDRCIAIYIYQYKILERLGIVDIFGDQVKDFSFGKTTIYQNNVSKIRSMLNTYTFKQARDNALHHGHSYDDLKNLLELYTNYDGIKGDKEKELEIEFKMSDK